MSVLAVKENPYRGSDAWLSYLVIANRQASTITDYKIQTLIEYLADLS
jgi:hypothetical protein